jgi:hypothetical protein
MKIKEKFYRFDLKHVITVFGLILCEKNICIYRQKCLRSGESVRMQQ